MSSHALPLLDLVLEALDKVRAGKMGLEELDLGEDIDLLQEKLNIGRIKLIKIHWKDAIEHADNKFRVKLELKEIGRYLWSLYREVGYSISPKGERWTPDQLEARKLIKELEQLKSEFRTNLDSKMSMSSVLAKYERKCTKISPTAGEWLKECADFLSDNEFYGCIMSLFYAQKELARFILRSSE